MEGDPWQKGFGGGRFRVVETTADIGVEATGPTMEAAQASAVAGLYHVIAPGAAVRGRRTVVVEATASDEAVAFARAMQKLVPMFDIERFLAAGARVQNEPGPPNRCTITLTGEGYDPEKHPYGVEVKAVTRHGIVFDRSARLVRLILDI